MEGETRTPSSSSPCCFSLMPSEELRPERLGLGLMVVMVVIVVVVVVCGPSFSSRLTDLALSVMNEESGEYRDPMSLAVRSVIELPSGVNEFFQSCEAALLQWPEWLSESMGFRATVSALALRPSIERVWRDLRESSLPK